MSGLDPSNGKWFMCFDYVIYPLLDNVLSTFITNYKRALAEIKAYSAAHPIPPDPPECEAPTPEERKFLAQALTDIITTQTAVMRETETKLYNAQPPWPMADVPAQSISEANEVLREFFEFADSASDCFNWWWASFYETKKWMRHGWKHITVVDLERIAKRVEAGKHPRGDLGPHFDVLLGSGDDVQELFLKAAGRVPEAVARLNHLLPSDRDKLGVARMFLQIPNDQASQLLSRIPSAAELAAECAEIAVRNPDSEEADRARRTIAALVAKSSAKGSKVGRPKIAFSGEALATVYRMSYALYKQVKEVDRFLGKLIPNNVERNQSLTEFYPWLAQKMRPEGLTDFAKTQPTEAAFEVAAKVLGLSVSKVRKSVLPARANRLRTTSP